MPLYTDIILLLFCLILFTLLLYIVMLLSRRIGIAQSHPHHPLSRHEYNPIRTPDGKFDWEDQGVFNPAAVIDDNGTVHMLYRAIGSDGVSRLGYDKSLDGSCFEHRLPYPVFSILNPRDKLPMKLRRHDPTLYPSGGSWGGCEDPRMVRIDGRVYVTFSAFDGWDFIRIGLVSIDEADFFNGKWRWSEPLLISPEHKINKNWVLFPEKINGKFAILHSVSPDVSIDYADSFEDLAAGKQVINSTFGGQSKRNTRRWDSKVRGAGPPPIKTDRGWLVIYHATDDADPNRYKMGALLLDLKDPRKVLARSNRPLLAPDMWYENDWKAGVVYACGAVIKDDNLLVYYGGGDKHACMARAPLKKIFAGMQRVE